MADLNDFFAKKDKKKKGGKKFSKANTDELATKLEEKDLKKAEDSTKNYEMPEEEKAASKDASPAPTNGDAPEANATPAAPPARAVSSDPVVVQLARASQDKTFGVKDKLHMNDDEWLSYDDEKDYSGLKIESLKVGKQPTLEEEEEHELNEEGEKVRKRGDGGPWNKQDGEGYPDPVRRAEPAPVAAAPVDTPAPAAAPATGGATRSSYVPPHMRGGPGPAPSSGPSMSSGGNSVNSRMAARRGNRAVPNISSELMFPTLGGEAVERPKGRMDDFEEVRGRGQQQPQSRGGSGNQRLDTSNKFSALRD